MTRILWWRAPHAFALVIALTAMLIACTKGEPEAGPIAQHDDAQRRAPRNATMSATPPRDAALRVEASCGQCNFGLTEPTGCDLAVRISGAAYFVDGSHIDDHGDAHAERGMCNAIRRAEVRGEVIKGRFVATHFTLID